jgi:hypothetical protein
MARFQRDVRTLRVVNAVWVHGKPGVSIAIIREAWAKT